MAKFAPVSDNDDQEVAGQQNCVPSNDALHCAAPLSFQVLHLIHEISQPYAEKGAVKHSSCQLENMMIKQRKGHSAPACRKCHIKLVDDFDTGITQVGCTMYCLTLYMVFLAGSSHVACTVTHVKLGPNQLATQQA